MVSNKKINDAFIVSFWYTRWPHSIWNKYLLEFIDQLVIQKIYSFPIKTSKNYKMMRRQKAFSVTVNILWTHRGKKKMYSFIILPKGLISKLFILFLVYVMLNFMSQLRGYFWMKLTFKLVKYTVLHNVGGSHPISRRLDIEQEDQPLWTGGNAPVDWLWTPSIPLAPLGLQSASPYYKFWTCQSPQLCEPIAYNKPLSIYTHILLVLFLCRILTNTVGLILPTTVIRYCHGNILICAPL